MADVQDQLTKPERVRLEALAQAVAQGMGHGLRSAEAVIDVAKRFERYIQTGET